MKSSTQRRLHRPRGRCGGALIYVLIVLLMISMMGTSLTRLAVTQHRQRQHDARRAQTVRLAEAGWNRALHQLAVRSDYSGETWQPEFDGAPPGQAAVVRIAIEPDDTSAASRHLLVVAEYPLESPNINRVTREGVVRATPTAGVSTRFE